MNQCKMPGCVNELPPGRIYECPACTSKIMAAARSFLRPLSELLNLGEEDVTPNPHTNPNQEPDRPGESATGNDSIGT